MSKTREKVQSIFRELVGERAEVLRANQYPADVNSKITTALTDHKNASEDEILNQDGVGFHVVDWNAEAAFLVALLLYPERFSDDEVKDGIDELLIHAPSHILEAARLRGHDTHNIFNKN